MTKSGLPAVLHQTLRAYAARQRRILVLRGLGETIMVQAAGLAAVAIIDASAHPGHGAHWALSLATYAATGSVFAVRVIAPLVARPRLVDHAHDIEHRSAGRLEERLSSAVELAGRPAGGVSAWMIERTIALAAQEAAGLDVVALFSNRPARVAWLRAGLVAAALAGCCLVPGVPMFLLRAAWPAVLRPSRIHLEVLPGDLRLASGSPLDLQIKASPDPGAASLAVLWDDGVSESMPLERAGEAGAYNLHLSAVTRGLRYRVLAGDGESRGYRVEVAQPPLLEKISLRITPPPYTGLPVRAVDGGDGEIIAGSMVSLQAQIGGAQSVSGSLTYDGGEHAAAIEGGLLRAELKPAATLSYGVRLVGASGLVAEPPQRWLLTVLPDKPPQVKLSGRGLEAGLVGRDEALAVEIEASDDIGLRAVELVIEVDGSERRHLPLTLPAGARRDAKLEVGVDLAGLSLALGAAVTLSARATDVGGQQSASKPLALAVAESADARGSALATRLRALLKRVDAENEALRAIARQWSTLARADHGDDQAAMTGELKLVGNRLDLWSSELGAASQQLRGDGLAGGMALSPLLVSLAEELVAWTRGVAHQLATAAQDAQDAHGAAALARGRGLSESALADLASFRRDLALVVARLEASTLAGGAESALARLQRALPIARGERGWRGEEGKAAEPGLLGVFYAGTELSGPERFREVAVPNWRDRDVPKLGRDNFSVRYSGEVLVPGDGDWWFMAGADDGVRLSVDGQGLLPKEAWKTQGYTDYRGHLRLKAGWHAIVLEMFQGTGGSGLGLAMGANEHEIHPLTAASLRSASARDGGELVRLMAELPREQIGAADQRMASALGMIALVPESISQIGMVAANDELNRLARQHHEPAAALAALSGKLAGADSQALLAAERSGSALTADARRARDLLEEQVGRELHGRVPAGDLSPLRQALARVRDRAQDLHRISDRLSSKDRELRQRIEFGAGRAWVAELGREALAVRRALLDEARRADALLPTRAAAVQGARRLAAFTPAVREALAALAAQPDQPHQAGDRLNEQAGRLEGLLHECEDWERKLTREQLVELAHAASAELPEHAASVDQARYQRLAALAAPVIRAVRRSGDTGQADALERMLGTGSADLHAAELADRLAQLGRDGQTWYGDLDRQTAEQLHASSGELAHRAKEAGQIALTVVDLDEGRLALALEAEHRRDQAPPGLAAAFALLSSDIGVVVDGTAAPTPEQVEEFAKRAAALANMRGDQERAAAIAAAAKHQEASPAASSLQALADQARHAADHAEERTAVVAALKTLAQADAARERAADAAKRQAAADQLRDLAARDAALKAEELAARQAFADAERALAVAMPALATEAKTVSSQVQDPELAKALAMADQELPLAARQARDLSAQASNRPAALRDVAAPAESSQPQPADQAQAAPGPSQQGDPTAQNAQTQPGNQQHPQAQNAQAQNAQAQNAQAGQAQPQQGSPAQPQNAPPQQPAQQNGQPQPPAAQQAQAGPQPQGQQNQAAAHAQQGSQAPPQTQPAASAGAQAPTADQAAAPQDGLPSAELVQRAEALADQIAAQAATPVAEHYQHHTTAKAGKDDPTRQPAAAVGRDLANLVAEERAAAERLAQAVGAEDQERMQLAQAVEAAAALAETPPADPAGQQAAQAASQQPQQPQQSPQARQAQQAAQQAQQAANDLQQQADRAQAAAQAAQAAADAAQGGDDQGKAQQGEAQAAAAEQQAVAAEAKALDAQLNALALQKEAARQSGDPQAEAAAAAAAGNLSAAEQDSLQALENAEHDGQSATAKQAAGNLARASAALKSLAGTMPHDAQALAQALSAQAAGEHAAPAGAPAAPAPGSDAAADAQVAAQALGEIQAAPGQGSSFQQAGQTLAAAALQGRLAHGLGHGQGQGQPQGQSQGQGQGKGPSGQPGGENQGTAASTGATGSALGLTTASSGAEQAEWAKSRAEVKQNVRSGGIEQFSEEHQESIRAYLKRLGEDQ